MVSQPSATALKRQMLWLLGRHMQMYGGISNLAVLNVFQGQILTSLFTTIWVKSMLLKKEGMANGTDKKPQVWLYASTLVKKLTPKLEFLHLKLLLGGIATMS